jgi:hypothetical protein
LLIIIRCRVNLKQRCWAGLIQSRPKLPWNQNRPRQKLTFWCFASPLDAMDEVELDHWARLAAVRAAFQASDAADAAVRGAMKRGRAEEVSGSSACGAMKRVVLPARALPLPVRGAMKRGRAEEVSGSSACGAMKRVVLPARALPLPVRGAMKRGRAEEVSGSSACGAMKRVVLPARALPLPVRIAIGLNRRWR